MIVFNWDIVGEFRLVNGLEDSQPLANGRYTNGLQAF